MNDRRNIWALVAVALATFMTYLDNNIINVAIPVIPRDDANSPCGLAAGCTNDSLWLSWTWRNPADNSVLFKSAAQSGSATLGEYVGTPDATGLEIPANTGDVGGFATGQWSATESISASWDANCTKNTVDNTY